MPELRFACIGLILFVDSGPRWARLAASARLYHIQVIVDFSVRANLPRGLLRNLFHIERGHRPRQDDTVIVNADVDSSQTLGAGKS